MEYNFKDIITFDNYITEKMLKMLLPGFSNYYEFTRWKGQLENNKFKGAFKSFDEAFENAKNNKYTKFEKMQILLSTEHWERPFKIVKFAKKLGFQVRMMKDHNAEGANESVLVIDKRGENAEEHKNVFLISPNLSGDDKQLALADLIDYYLDVMHIENEVIIYESKIKANQNEKKDINELVK